MLVIVRSRFLITATRDAQSHTHAWVEGTRFSGAKGVCPAAVLHLWLRSPRSPGRGEKWPRAFPILVLGTLWRGEFTVSTCIQVALTLRSQHRDELLPGAPSGLGPP